jgi:VWFA-related protein
MEPGDNMRRRLGLFALSFAFAASVFAQGNATPQLTERIDVRITNLEVVVTDKKGEPVRGLTRDDFELIAGGVAQPITNFYEASLQPGASADSEATTRAPRHVILYVDNTSLTAQHRKKLVEDMSGLLGTTLTAKDQTMVVTFDRQLRVRLPFTSDLQAVRTVLETIANEPGGGDSYRRQAQIAQTELLGAQHYEQRLQIARSYAEFARGHLEQSLAAMKTVMQSVSGIDGRKVMILASEGMPVHPGIEIFQYLEVLNSRKFGTNAIEPPSESQVRQITRGKDGNTYNVPPPATKPKPTPRSVMADAKKYDARLMIQELAKSANAYGLAVYAIHGGAIAGSGAAEADSGRANQGSNVMRDLRSNTEESMKLVADQTGGIASVGSQHMDLFGGIRTDLTAYYSLGFRSTAPGEREVKVRVKKPGRYNVRYRHSLLQKPLEQELSDRVVAHLFMPSVVTDSTVRLALGATVPHAEGKVRVPVRINVPYETLTLLEKSEDKTYGGAFDVYIAVVDATGSVSPVVKRTQAVSVKDLAETKGKNFPYAMQFLMNSNARRVSVAVVDSATQLTSFATHDVAVSTPDAP